MKKRVSFLLIAACFLTTTVMAQGMMARDVDFGVKAGLTYATLRGDNAEDAEYILGFAAGAFANVPLTPMFSIQPELLYVQKGATVADEGTEVDFNLSYIEVPVLLKYTVATSGQVQPSLYAGPYAALAVKQEVSGEEVSVDVEDFLKDIDFGLTVGGNVGFMLSGKKLTVGARYDLGLTNIFETESEAIADDSDIKTGTIAVLLGIAF